MYTARRVNSRRNASLLSHKGFTLLELLVALAVFAVLSVMAYSGLRAVLNGRDHVEQQAARLGELQTAFTIMERDVEQTIGRDIRDSYGERQPAMIGGQFGTTLLELTRTGWRNPAGLRRSDLQRVAYRLVDDQLSRAFWQVIDQAQDSAPLERVLLKNVKNMEVRYLDDALEWQGQWPPDTHSEEKSALPRAVEVTVELDGFGKIKRLFRVAPGEAALRAPPAAGGSGVGGS